MQTKYQTVNNLKISVELLSFINDELLKDTNISPEKFWNGFDKAVHELAPRNRELIKIREDLQKKLMGGILKTKIKISLWVIEVKQTGQQL